MNLDEESLKTEFIEDKRRRQSLTMAPVASPKIPAEKKRRRRSILKKDSKFGDKRKNLSITFNETVVIHELKTWHYMDKLRKRTLGEANIIKDDLLLFFQIK